ncbi:hypothetical protein HanRHA438_Chr03g0098771 [Helianthus annuus]|nr:hypothetical protein HanIR_Chr12g0611871 [Helianthus annuus]KAJ0933669.1 hypothetical protein HanRHA438_Chr03g0098771 [Helianthus annuus]
MDDPVSTKSFNSIRVFVGLTLLGGSSTNPGSTREVDFVVSVSVSEPGPSERSYFTE